MPTPRDGALPPHSTGSRQRHAPARAIQPEPHDVHPAQPRRAIERVALWQIADRAVGLPGRAAQHGELPADSISVPSSAFSSVDLPDPFAPSSATNSPGAIASDTPLHTVRPPTRTPAPRSSSAMAAPGWADASGAAARVESFSVALAGGRSVLAAALTSPVAACSAFINPSSSAACHCWKLSLAGESVSVTVAMGIPLALAISFTRCTSGVTFWLLNTHTLISRSSACRSTVRLSFGGHFRALGDSLDEAVGGQQLAGRGLRQRPWKMLSL